jgi:hypothetical protein
MKLFKSLSISTILGALLLSISAHAVPPTTVSGLVGTWYNTNSSTGGIVKFVVTQTASGLTFKSYGACSPTPCVHTTVVAYPHSAGVSSNTAIGFTSYRNDTFKYTRFSALRVGANMRLDAFSTFAAGDTRKDYVLSETFTKLLVIAPVSTVEQILK